MLKSIFPRYFLEGAARIVYHVLLVALSTGLALSLPHAFSYTAQKLLAYWSYIENEKVFVVAVEIIAAALFILFFNYIGTSWKNKRLSQMAATAGMVHCFPPGGYLLPRRIRKLKHQQGLNRDVLIISATGFRTFVNSQGDLHAVLRNCREAKIMLLNPRGSGAGARAKSMTNPNVTPELFDEQIRRSIAFLKELKGVQKNITLKLYDDAPFLKLAILGDYLWLRHYHPGLDVFSMPEYVFKHDQGPGGLYTPFYQYFLTRWKDPKIPEYDLGSDDLVYRDAAANEIRRKKFDPCPGGILSSSADAPSGVDPAAV